LLSTCVDVCSGFDCEIHEPGRGDNQGYLSFQESTGNSTGPECYVLLRALRYGFLHENVTNL
jgi:hypothetical protein